MVRRRHGSPAFNSLAGLSPVGGSDIVAFAPGGGNVVNKIFNLLPPPTGSALTGQIRRDGILVQIARDAANGGDTCTGNIFINGITVRYVTSVP